MLATVRHYQVVRSLGAGGMGEVFLAQDTRLDRSVALKFLPAESAGDSRHRQRFLTEAKAVAALNHPNICTIYEVGEAEDGRPFIAMELLEGETLGARLKRGNLEMPELIEIGLQIVEALSAAHAKGIVHRDIKPSNLHVTGDGRVKVLDFGLAKRLAVESATEEAATLVQTQVGQVLGTPNYMSPEQALAGEVDARTDLFALGTVLYEMVTGRAPFAGRNVSETLDKILQSTPEALARFNPAVPAELERMILKCLRKAPEERYQSARDLIVDLRSLKESLRAPETVKTAVMAPAWAGTGQVVTLLFLSTNGEEVEKSLGVREATQLLQAHQTLFEQRLRASSQSVVLERGRNATLLSFARPSSAVQFALGMQLATAKPLTCRIGIHLGEVVKAQADKAHEQFGEQLVLCERLLQVARPGQILMSRAVFDSARQVVRTEAVEGLGQLSWLNHGPYVLEGVDGAVEICEIAEAGQKTGGPPTTSVKAQRQVTPGEEQVLGWRPALGQAVPNTKWVLEQKLGEGGFGEVWLGRHETLKDRRVFKFCFRADRVRSLKREVTLFRLLKEKVGQHPNIVGIQEVFFDAPPFYIVMDYEAGQDLRGWWEAQGGAEKVPLATRLEIVAQVADALQAAHEAGVIHRDVKPSNILVHTVRSSRGNEALTAVPSGGAEKNEPPHVGCYEVRAKLTDFGIGQVVSQEALAGLTKAGFTQTMMGSGSSSHTGTQLYMAPELLAGKPASARSDIYSLGVVLFQILAGDFSHPLTTDWAREINDPLLREDLQKCFAGNPQERFAEAGQLARNLRALGQRRADLALRERAATRGRLLRRTTVAFALVTAVLLLALFAFKQGRGGDKEAPPVKLAVLPLVNLSGVVDEDYFANETTDDLISNLGRISALRVIGRATVMQFQKTTNSVPEIARNLNVDFVVQGTFKRATDKVQIGVRLFKGPTDRPLWSAEYERDVRDVFTLQNEVALAIVRKMKLKLHPEEQARFASALRVKPEALDLYYKGKAVRLGDGDTTNKEQIKLYQRAVAIDMDFAPAWAALAGANIFRFYRYEAEPDKPWKGNAEKAVLKAITLNPTLAEAWAQNGRLYWHPGNFDHEKALQLFHDALKLNPSSGEALNWMGWVYNHTGFFDGSLACANEAEMLDPLGQGLYQSASRACSLLWKGEHEQSLSLWPGPDSGILPSLCGSHWAWALFALGRTNEANAKLQKYFDANADDQPGELTAMKAVLLAAEGKKAESIGQLKIAEQKTNVSFGETHHATYFIACAYARLNETQAALKWLKQTAESGFPCYPLFRDDPNLKNLHPDVGFITFLQEQKTVWEKRKADWAKYEAGGKRAGNR